MTPLTNGPVSLVKAARQCRPFSLVKPEHKPLSVVGWPPAPLAADASSLLEEGLFLGGKVWGGREGGRERVLEERRCGTEERKIKNG